MKSGNVKMLKFAGILILFAYIGIGVFGLFNFRHSNEMSMGNCPYTQNSFSVCENTFEHIKNWQQFSNVIMPSFFALTLLTYVAVLYFFNTQNFSNYLSRISYIWRFYIKKKFAHISLRKIIRYLSLFENSPSIFLKA